MFQHSLPFSTTSLWCLVILVAACSPAGVDPRDDLGALSASRESELWARLLEQVPYPYTTPLPPEKSTALDGIYGKLDPREGTRPMCRRCMPYPAEGGLWLLQLDRGVYRILSTRSLSGWRSLGSYAVDGDQIALFNDPHCMDAVGRYGWQLEEGQLNLELVEDECADGWRGITFTNYPWKVGN
jgi:hypothetical protein